MSEAENPTPAPAPLVDLVLDGLASEHSHRAYRLALGEFFSWYPSNASGEGFTRAVVQRYRSHLGERGLSAASINLALAALRKLATEAAAAILRVGGARRTGIRTGNWLTLPQAQQLLEAPDPSTPKGLRDRVLLGLLVGSGLRRGELAGLGFGAVAQREGRWAIVDLVGKHGRVRTVPMPSWAKAALDGWAAAAGIDSGPVLRRVSMAGRVGPGPLTPQAVFETVAAYGLRIGVRITPHDLRRTFAKLAHQERADQATRYRSPEAREADGGHQVRIACRSGAATPRRFVTPWVGAEQHRQRADELPHWNSSISPGASRTSARRKRSRGCMPRLPAYQTLHSRPSMAVSPSSGCFLPAR